MEALQARRPFRVRAIAPGDCDRMLRFYADLSPESRQARFHGAAPRLETPAAAYFCGPDHAHREGLVAETLDGAGTPVMIGHVCLEPAGRGLVEMAIAVADGWQRRGVGRALLAAAIEWARVHGFACLTASMLCGNAAVLALVRSTGLPISYGAGDGGTIDVLLRIGDALPSAA
jgi:acetyltransferase